MGVVVLVLSWRFLVGGLAIRSFLVLLWLCVFCSFCFSLSIIEKSIEIIRCK